MLNFQGWFLGFGMRITVYKEALVPWGVGEANADAYALTYGLSQLQLFADID